jgi:hypothetical protein
MRPFEGSFSASGASKVDLCLADCTINTYGFNLRQGQVTKTFFGVGWRGFGMYWHPARDKLWRPRAPLRRFNKIMLWRELWLP